MTHNYILLSCNLIFYAFLRQFLAHWCATNSNFPFWTLHKVSVSSPFITLLPFPQRVADLPVLAQLYYPEEWLPTQMWRIAERKQKGEGVVQEYYRSRIPWGLAFNYIKRNKEAEGTKKWPWSFSPGWLHDGDGISQTGNNGERADLTRTGKKIVCSSHPS